MAEFKDIIKKLRTEKNMSQAELASELNISNSSVAMWEIGKRYPSKELYEQLADLFNVDIDYLYGRVSLRQKIHFDGDGNAMVPMDYYINDETAAIAQEIFEKDKVLFDVYKSSDKDRLVAYANKLKALRDMEEGNI